MERRIRRVIVVEDHPVMRETIGMLIGELPRVELLGTFPTAEEALGYVDSDAPKPDLLTIDISLPGLSGIDLLREIRRRDPDIPCVVVSGHSERQYEAAARKAGAVDFVMKGDARKLVATLQSILDRKSAV